MSPSRAAQPWVVVPWSTSCPFCGSSNTIRLPDHCKKDAECRDCRRSWRIFGGPRAR